MSDDYQHDQYNRRTDYSRDNYRYHRQNDADSTRQSNGAYSARPHSAETARYQTSQNRSSNQDAALRARAQASRQAARQSSNPQEVVRQRVPQQNSPRYNRQNVAQQSAPRYSRQGVSQQSAPRYNRQNAPQTASRYSRQTASQGSAQQAAHQGASRYGQQNDPRYSRQNVPQNAAPETPSRYSRQNVAQGAPRYNNQNPAQQTNNRYTQQQKYQYVGQGQSILPQLSRRGFMIGAGVVGVAAVFGLGSMAYASFSGVAIKINGQDVSVKRNATIKDAFEAAGQPANPGNFVDVKGDVLQEGEGNLFSVSADGQDIDYSSADSINATNYSELIFSDGADVEEDATIHESVTIPFETIDRGTGSFHIMTNPGRDGIKNTKTGNISGKTVTKMDQEKEDRIFDRCYPDVGEDKVVALTFDDGPWDKTNELLDVLKENDAKATFFVVGQRVSGDGVDAVKREVEEGHQVATHTWDHAAGSGQGVNLSLMSAEEQREEIEKGFEAIKNATDNEPSHVMRAPGGNFPTEVWSNVYDLIDIDVSWDIDTEDWRKPGSDAIKEKLLKVKSGDIVLMHDGGGDRSQTIEAVRQALPKLKEEGWSFITIDQLREYPTKDSI